MHGTSEWSRQLSQEWTIHFAGRWFAAVSCDGLQQTFEQMRLVPAQGIAVGQRTVDGGLPRLQRRWQCIAGGGPGNRATEPLRPMGVVEITIGLDMARDGIASIAVCPMQHEAIAATSRIWTGSHFVHSTADIRR